ncbi:hypothetical protein GIB67_037746 [Kingdonia uniflora]|uniref:Uncharacterized protein n=1 Tax=Kingdonia uniflora TaxID=39325 RepID=A0A7J7LUW1_9MAGN|nr:hypothetical protein GIB67_037746 [Kingdonia uniflora]
MEILNKMRNLDAYPKINEDFYSRTLSGGLITLFSSIAILFLFFSELGSYLHVVTESKLSEILLEEKLSELTYFDVTFPALACSLLSIDAMDISGEQHYDIRHDIIKKRIDHLGNVIESKPDLALLRGEEEVLFPLVLNHRHLLHIMLVANESIGLASFRIEKPLQRHGGRLDHNETYCGSCYGAEVLDDDCCNSCEEVRQPYRKKGWALSNPDFIDQCKREGFFQKIKEEDGEGCNIHGFVGPIKLLETSIFLLEKVSRLSNFQLFDLLALQTENFNISHKINKLSFGEKFPSIINPLDG